MQNQPCPCLSNNPYNQCCEPFHSKKQKPQSAEQLMRSRYCAFVLKNIDYLIDTFYPSKRKADDKLQLQKTIEQTRWIGLKIINTNAGQPTDKTGEVEFVAFYQEQTTQQLHEKSQFIKDNDQWFYFEGEHLPPIKLGRNDQCFCGSGKKVKKCHPQ